jgi:ABC-type enterochelin transport system substrate-binding protein
MKKEAAHFSETLLSTYETIQYQNPDVLLVFMRRENRQNCIRKKRLAALSHNKYCTCEL